MKSDCLLLIVLLFSPQEVSKDAHQQVDDVIPAPQFVQTPAGLIQAPGLVINPQLGSGSTASAVTKQEPPKPQKKVGRGELILNEDEQDEDMSYVSFYIYLFICLFTMILRAWDISCSLQITVLCTT